jgi:hypothetical protein
VSKACGVVHLSPLEKIRGTEYRLDRLERLIEEIKK